MSNAAATPKPDTLSTFEFFNLFPDEEAARVYFEKNRWNGETHCGHCGSTNSNECKDHKPMAYRCRDCRKHFSVRTGTVLAESRLPLQKWLLAIFMLTSARKGIPSTQMARELGVTQKTAWFLAQRIRETWLGGDSDSMGSEAQVGKTYIGGKEKSKHATKKLHAGRSAVGKTAFVGIRDDHGQVRAAPIASTDAASLQGYINANVPAGASVVTDECAVYRRLSQRGYTLMTANQSVGEYVRHFCLHTNGIDSFWALLKRGYYCVYHYMSPKHLHRNVNEFAFRQNTAKVGTMQCIDMFIARMAGKRLTYKGLANS